MAISKVILNNQTLVDVTSDTVTAATLQSGETATANNGEKITGILIPSAGVTIETVNHTQTESAKNMTINDPQPTKLPKLVITEINPEDIPENPTDLNTYAYFVTFIEEPVLYQSYNRWHSFVRYYNAEGTYSHRTVATNSANSAGFSSPRGTIRIPGYNATYNNWIAARYTTKLYYWD